jgi:hypothetical protein
MHEQPHAHPDARSHGRTVARSHGRMVAWSHGHRPPDKLSQAQTSNEPLATGATDTAADGVAAGVYDETGTVDDGTAPWDGDGIGGLDRDGVAAGDGVGAGDGDTASGSHADAAKPTRRAAMSKMTS